MKKLSWTGAAMLLAAASLTPAQPRPPSAPPGPPSQMGPLSAAKDALGRGEADKVVKDIQALLLKCPSNELSMALTLKAKAQGMLASKADGEAKKKLLRLAALDFLKVSTFFPYAPEAPSAMLEAAAAMKAAGEPDGARALLELCAARYGDTDAGAEAAKLLGN